MSTREADEEYKAWIRTLPCHICGWIPRGTYKRYNQYKDQYDNIQSSNCVHHTGDGIHTLRWSDYWAVPLCDHNRDPNSNNCHHREVHSHPGKWVNTLRKAAAVYRERYLKEKV